jgi:hypothetical protein
MANVSGILVEPPAWRRSDKKNLGHTSACVRPIEPELRFSILALWSWGPPTMARQANASQPWRLILQLSSSMPGNKIEAATFPKNADALTKI